MTAGIKACCRAAWKCFTQAAEKTTACPPPNAAEATDFFDAESDAERHEPKHDPEKPKKPINCYLRFMKDYRAKYSGMKMTDAAKSGGVAWKALSQEQKRPYMKQYAEEKAVYDAKLQECKASVKKNAKTKTSAKQA